MVATREVIIPTGMEILYEKYHYCPGIRIGNTVMSPVKWVATKSYKWLRE